MTAISSAMKMNAPMAADGWVRRRTEQERRRAIDRRVRGNLLQTREIAINRSPHDHREWSGIHGMSSADEVEDRKVIDAEGTSTVE